ncbi:MAG: RusA family crossover junction endodeoxyribonuclease [Candidatus Omnitrophica bacterium]|nr:RusA family crossover junction endodeoxyribonuclease [Candidatus Omnitrophota bacterium]
MLIAEFFIPVIPTAKGRPRFFRRGNFVGTYTPKKTAGYEQEIFVAANRYARENHISSCYEGPIAAELVFYLPRPKSHNQKQRSRQWHIIKPDTDNLIKAVYDAINGIFFKDDSQVCSEKAIKIYATDTQSPGVFLRLEKL